MAQTSAIDHFFDRSGISPEDIPKIPLYMDQLLGLMDSYFEDFRRTDKEKIMTKTMINNYVKSKLIQPPVKKKYAREQFMLLALIDQLKNIVSITDIQLFFDMYDDPAYTKNARNERIAAYFKIFGKLQKNHLAVLKERYNTFQASEANEEDKKALVAHLLVEADLNKRLALLIMDDMHTEND